MIKFASIIQRGKTKIYCRVEALVNIHLHSNKDMAVQNKDSKNGNTFKELIKIKETEIRFISNTKMRTSQLVFSG